MAGTGHIQLNFDGVLTWAEFKRVVNNANGIPGSATVLLGNDGSTDPSLREQKVIADWELTEMGQSMKRGSSMVDPRGPNA